MKECQIDELKSVGQLLALGRHDMLDRGYQVEISHGKDIHQTALYSSTPSYIFLSKISPTKKEASVLDV